MKKKAEKKLDKRIVGMQFSMDGDRIREILQKLLPVQIRNDFKIMRYRWSGSSLDGGSISYGDSGYWKMDLERVIPLKK